MFASSLLLKACWKSSWRKSQTLVKKSSFSRLRPFGKRLQSGLTIVEVAVSVTLLALFGVAGVDALLSLNKNASSTRAIAAAREVVQRNMEAAMTVPFSTTSIPGILQKTTDLPEIPGWDETKDVDQGSVQIPLIQARDGTVIVSGTLKRAVDIFSNGAYHPATRRITFTLSYSMNGKAKPDYVLTSIRSPDK